LKSLPDALLNEIAIILKARGDAGEITRVQVVGGGCINNARRVWTYTQSYFLKWNPDPLPGLFGLENHGLALLAATGTVHIPEVYGLSDGRPGLPPFILQEWAAGEQTLDTLDMEALGRQLASLHLHKGETRYGFDRNNYIGSSPQINTWKTSWVDFFRDCRLTPQMNMAISNRLMPPPRQRRLERLMERLDHYLPRTPECSLIHGDLWGGNVISGKNGQPVLIDPAVYYGDSEAELAFTEVFGGFSQRFFQAYDEVRPLDKGYLERRHLYNLYHMLNHLNIFGESYGDQVDSILARFGP